MPKRILIADDEVRILTVLQKRLEHAGYLVTTASDGLEALTKARADPPDCAILDLNMPKLSGYEVCAALKLEARFKHVPILMLTALSQEKDVHEGFEVGADAYMTKPFNHETLLEQVAGLIAKFELERKADEAKGAAGEGGATGK
jgi:DNA-binding response OmpR family regulator